MLIGSTATAAVNVNSLLAGAFLLCSLAMVATRQIQACLRFFYIQALLLGLSAVTLSQVDGVPDLLMFAAITFAGKCVALPLLLSRVVPSALLRRREINQVFNIPTTLISAVVLALVGFVTMKSITADGLVDAHPVNAAVGMAALLVGVLGFVTRREPLPQLAGLLALENAVFLSALAVGPTLPIVVELGIAFDLLVLVVVAGLLAALMHRSQDGRTGGDIVTKERL